MQYCLLLGNQKLKYEIARLDKIEKMRIKRFHTTLKR